MGRTLFSEYAKPLRSPDGQTVLGTADSLYRAVDQAKRAIAGRKVQG